MFLSKDREVDVLMIRLDESSFGEGDAYHGLYMASGLEKYNFHQELYSGASKCIQFRKCSC